MATWKKNITNFLDVTYPYALKGPGEPPRNVKEMLKADVYAWDIPVLALLGASGVEKKAVRGMGAQRVTTKKAVKPAAKPVIIIDDLVSGDELVEVFEMLRGSKLDSFYDGNSIPCETVDNTLGVIEEDFVREMKERMSRREARLKEQDDDLIAEALIEVGGLCLVSQSLGCHIET